MRRSAVILILLLLGVTMLCAQTPLEKMNSIKMSQEYIWDEYTHISPDTATMGAVSRLLLYIDVPEGKSLTVDNIMGSVKFIKMKRSTLTRVFAYMSKNTAQALANGEQKVDTVDVADAVVSETVSDAVSDVVADSVAPFHPMPVAQELMSQPDFYSAYKHIQQLQEQGIITAYGSLKNSNDIDNQYLVIFQKQTNRPLCVLSPVQAGENRTNLVDGNTESLVKYEDGNHIAVWFNINSNIQQ